MCKSVIKICKFLAQVDLGGAHFSAIHRTETNTGTLYIIIDVLYTVRHSRWSNDGMK